MSGSSCVCGSVVLTTRSGKLEVLEMVKIDKTEQQYAFIRISFLPNFCFFIL